MRLKYLQDPLVQNFAEIKLITLLLVGSLLEIALTLISSQMLIKSRRKRIAKKFPVGTKPLSLVIMQFGIMFSNLPTNLFDYEDSEFFNIEQSSLFVVECCLLLPSVIYRFVLPVYKVEVKQFLAQQFDEMSP